MSKENFFLLWKGYIQLQIKSFIFTKLLSLLGFTYILTILNVIELYFTLFCSVELFLKRWKVKWSELVWLCCQQYLAKFNFWTGYVFISYSISSQCKFPTQRPVRCLSLSKLPFLKLNLKLPFSKLNCSRN